MDRFSQGYTPIIDVEFGSCQGCGGVIYQYELAICGWCASEVHFGCLQSCERCGFEGCRTCLSKDPDTLEWVCEECRKEIQS